MALGRSIDPEIEAFVHETIDSFVTWDVIVLFHDWPGFAGDAAAVAKHLGRNERDVARSLARLARLGMVRSSLTGRSEVYSFGPDDATSDQIDRFCSVLDQRETRLALLASLLRKGIS